jgi:hypothetical protein
MDEGQAAGEFRLRRGLEAEPLAQDAGETGDITPRTVAQFDLHLEIGECDVPALGSVKADTIECQLCHRSPAPAATQGQDIEAAARDLTDENRRQWPPGGQRGEVHR